MSVYVRRDSDRSMNFCLYFILRLGKRCCGLPENVGFAQNFAQPFRTVIGSDILINTARKP